MYKAKILAIATILIVLMVFPVFADELELGMSLTPIATIGEDNPDPTAEDGIIIQPGFHIGYRFAWIGFVSWDSYVMPPELITLMTATYDPVTEKNTLGPFRPGFLNTWNIGGKLVLGPLVGYSTIGVNNIYVYKQDEFPDENFNASFGANWKIGAGLKFGDWGINLDLMALFPSVSTMFAELEALGSDDPAISAAAEERIQWIPSLVATLYL
jgi:hypothetical protein